MLSLREFLAAAPKTFVIKLHRRDRPGEGLMQAAKVIELVFEWAIRAERVAAALEEAGAPGLRMLALVYASGERGAAEAELLGNLEGFAPSQALQTLGRLEQELLVYSREGEKTRSYHGFEELADSVLARALADLTAPAAGSESAMWISYRHFLLSHLCHFMGRVSLGGVKITQGGELHRKDAQDLGEKFAFGERLSGALAEEEVQFLLHFAADRGLVLQEHGTLRLSPAGREFLRLDREQAWLRLARWWLSDRLRGFECALEAFAGAGTAGPFRISAWASVFWIASGTYRKGYGDPKSSFTWENLPRALQELWLLGLADFGMAKGRIAWIRPDRDAMALAAGDLPRPAEMSTKVAMAPTDRMDRTDPAPTRPISLPNLETLVPLDAPLARLAELEQVALKSNDEFMGRWRFTKESVIKGLQAGLPAGEFDSLLSWLGFEGHTRQTLQEWASTYSSTVFVDTLLLKVSDPHRFRELQEIPQFLELVSEVIPGYGFSLDRRNKAQVKELLQHFGLVPGEDVRRQPELEPVSLGGAASAWALAGPESGPPTYRESPGSMRAPPPAPEKGAEASREQETAAKLEALETAISGGKKVEFTYPSPGPRRIACKPLLVLKHRDPPKVIGIEADSGHRNEYVLDQMKALKVID